MSKLFFRSDSDGNGVVRVKESDGVSPDLENGMEALREGRLDDARQVFESVLESDQENEIAWVSLSQVHAQRHDLKAAKSVLDQAIEFLPDLARAYLARAAILKNSRRFKEAIRDYRRTIELDPGSISAYINLGATYNSLGDFDQALECAVQALEIEPDNVVAGRNRGLMLRELGKYGEAEAVLRKVLSQHPDHHDTSCSLAMVLIDQGHFREAEKLLTDVLNWTGGAHTEANWYLAISHLLQGRFRDGWLHYGSRLHRHDAHVRSYAYPVWNGATPLTEKLLIYAEQGLGDDILFASCLPDVLAAKQKVIIECDPRLTALFRRSFPTAEVVGTKNESDPSWVLGRTDISAQIAAGTLPGLFRNSLSDFSVHSGYLIADRGKVKKWQARLSQLGGGLKVGIAWTGGSLKTRRRIRSLCLSDLLPALSVPGVNFVSLQYLDSRTEIQRLSLEHGIHVHHWQEAIDDYDETAALVNALDLVISVCTTVVHLAGASGKEVWVMVPAAPEWRYLHVGSTLPWYPTARLFRQTRLRQWSSVVAAIARALNERGQRAGPWTC